MSQKLTQFLTYRVLDHKFSGHRLLDHMFEDGKADVQLKNMCAKVPAEFDQNVADLSEFLGIRKAEFIRRAVESAMVEAEAVMQQYLDESEIERDPHFVDQEKVA